MKQFKYSLFGMVLSIGMNAQLKTYDYYRQLNPVPEKGYYQLRVGSSVLDREGYYRVYKIGEKDTIEVPYVTERYDWSFQDKRYFKELKVIDKSYEKGKYSYATAVVDTNLLYTSVYLNFSGREFFKDVTLEGSHDNKSWKIITENEKLFHYFPANDAGYFRNRIDFDPISFKYLRVKVDDSQTPGLELVSASIPIVKEQIIEEGEFVESFQNRSEDPKKKQTIIECQFPRAYAITDFQMEIANENPYHREILIEFFNPVNGKEQWISYGGGIISSNSKNRIYVPQMSGGDFYFKSSKMRVVILNNDDQPLGKISIKPFTFQEEIRLKLEKDNKYVLAYGKKNDEQPTYDLDHFKNIIAVVSEVGIGAEQKILHETKPVQQPLINNKKWIWAALIACILVIGIFALKLLKPEQKQS
jgi:hypothetical protein